MDAFFRIVLKKRSIVIAVFITFAVLCLILQTGVNINYRLSDYLPKGSVSTIALNEMQREFPGGMQNARVMIKNVSITEAIRYKEQLSEIDGVTSVTWLDDFADIRIPLELMDKEIVQSYYKDGSALFLVAIENAQEVRVIGEIRKITGDSGAISGQAVTIATSQEMAAGEATKAIIFLIPIIIVILLLATTSWIEPVLFLAAIGISVLMNMGTNFFLKDVSFITNSIGPILQMAVSLDYAIFLLSSFSKARGQTDNDSEAMAIAMKRSFPAIIASAMTTVFGFLALVFMRFSIGSNLGIVLAKGIILSFVSVMIFLPALTLTCSKLLDKTRHRSVMLKWQKPAKLLMKLRIPALILVLILIVPSFLAQNRNSFAYGIGVLDPETRAGMDEAAINEVFGKSASIILLVPKGDTGTELELAGRLSRVPNIISVVSYVTSIGADIPQDVLPDSTVSQFYSDKYSRMIIYSDTENEGTEAFAVVEQVREIAREYYGEEALTCGESTSLYDIRSVVTTDSTFVNVLAIAAIGIVILLTFRSLSMPIILLITIETSIWINLSIPYFSGTILCYIGFLVINTVQLGATVDYAILFSDHYLLNRKTLPPKSAAVKTLQETMGSILVSMTILSAAGFIVGLTSSTDIVSQLGILLGRGAILSAAMVLIFLPAAAILADKIVGATTYKSEFFREEGRKNEKTR